MSSNNDFEIENGVLVQYTGAGGDVVIPDGVTSIGDWAFAWCEGLSSGTMPDSVTSIEDHAFCECTSLTSIVIPNGVTTIGDYMFHSCKSLTSIMIPKRVINIVEAAFWGCESLTNIKIAISDEKFLIVGYYIEVEKDIVAVKEMLRTGKMDTEVKMPLCMKFQMAVEMIDLHDNAEAKAYVKKMLTKGVKMLFDNGNLQLIQVLLGKTDFVTKKNVDKYIQYAIDQKQQEIYLDLIRYKNAIMA